MTVYRATRNEPRVGVGNWTGDFRRGQTYVGVEPSGYDPNGKPVYPRNPGQIPEYIGVYLMSHGLLVDARIQDTPAETAVPPSPVPPVVIPLDDEDDEDG